MQKLVECEHCHGAKFCKADRGRSCEVCRTAAGQGRKGAPTPARCSFCMGRGRIWVEAPEEEAAEAEGEGAPEDAAESAAEPPSDS